MQTNVVFVCVEAYIETVKKIIIRYKDPSRYVNIYEIVTPFSDLRVSLYKYQRLTMEALDMASLRF